MHGLIGPFRNARGYTLVELTVTLLIFAVIMAGVVGTWAKAQEAYFVGSEAAEVQQNARAAIDFMVREIRAAGRDTTQCAIDYSATSPLFTGQDCDGAKVTSCKSSLGAPSTWTCAGVHAIPCIPDGSCTTYPSLSRLVVRADRNDSGGIWGTASAMASDTDGSENVDYQILADDTVCGQGAACISRTQGGGGTQAMVGVDIDTTQTKFVYFPRRGYSPCDSATTPADQPCPSFTPASQADADNIGRIRIQVKAVQMVAGEPISRTMVTDIVLRNRN